MVKVLFVCHGNICRSPMAELVFKKMIELLGISNDFHVESKGTSNEEEGNPVYKQMIPTYEALGIDYSKHKARQIQKEDYDKFDYIIGSVHYIKIGEEYVPVDFSAQKLKDAADKYFDGDIYPLLEEYYRLVGTITEKIDADIIGHFDLITKFQEKEPLFDENDQRYVNAWKAAADKLIKANVPFEINSGAISRGYRTTPYPSPAIKEYILKNGGRFIYNSDSHQADTVANFKNL